MVHKISSIQEPEVTTILQKLIYVCFQFIKYTVLLCDLGETLLNSFIQISASTSWSSISLLALDKAALLWMWQQFCLLYDSTYMKVLDPLSYFDKCSLVRPMIQLALVHNYLIFDAPIYSIKSRIRELGEHHNAFILMEMLSLLSPPLFLLL